MEAALPHLLLVSALLLSLFASYAAWQSGVVLFSKKRSVSLPLETIGGSQRALEREKGSLLVELTDLAQDRALDKLSEEDFVRQQRLLRERAREVLRLLEEDLGPYLERADALIERRTAKAAGRPCPACGTSNDPDARFCKECARGLRGKKVRR